MIPVPEISSFYGSTMYILVSVMRTNGIEHVFYKKSSDNKCREVPAHYSRAQFHHVLHAAGDF